MSELFRRGYPVFLGRNQDERTTEAIPGMDMVVLPRLSWKPDDHHLGIGWREQLHAMGVAMVFEWDDDVFLDRINARAADVYREEGRTVEEWDVDRQSRIFAVQIADGITCSTQRLATRLRTITDKPVKVVGNYIDLAWWRSIQSTVQRGLPEPVIGWAGGRRPDRDCEPMAEAWANVARRHPEARFVVAGWQPAIFSRIPERQLLLSEWLPVLEYPKNYTGIDIACCPLADEPFNRAKTPIKAMEFAASGSAVVASPTVYGQLVKHGETGYLAESVADWEWAIEDLLKSRKRRLRMARRLLKVVERDWSLEANAHRWVAAWSDILLDFHERQGRNVADVILPPASPVATGTDAWRASE